MSDPDKGTVTSPTSQAGGDNNSNNSNANSAQQQCGNNNRSQQASPRDEPRKTTKFTGACNELVGHIFEMNGPATQYLKTIKHFQQYVARTYRESPSLAYVFDTPPIQPSVDKPDDEPTPTGPKDKDGNPTVSELDKLEFHKEVKDYFKRKQKFWYLLITYVPADFILPRCPLIY